jgi:glycosyltransferase involved in cell wall biosynthesis
LIRVLVITNNLLQASFRLRMDALRGALQMRGVVLDIQVRPRSMWTRRAMLKTAGDYDAVILQRKMLDPSDMRLLRNSSKKLFYDVDDAVMYHSRPVGWIEQWRTMRRFRSVARSVDMVVAGNEYLAGLFRAEGATAAILPTVVDPAHYRVKSHSATDQPTLVWIGSKSTLPYLAQLGAVLHEVARRVPGIRLVTIADVPLVDPPIPAEHVLWSAETEAEALVRGDIGIAPTPEDRWTLGKCGFKIIQYMASGLPAVASPVGANREIIVEGETGFLPRSSAEWVDSIVDLATNPTKRQMLGDAGRKRVEEQFSLDRAADFWAGLLTK